jgi:hypothetical protein
MADVYSQAHVVISADSANDARESIFTAKGQLTNKAISIPCSGPSKAKNIQVYARVVTQRKAGTEGLGHSKSVCFLPEHSITLQTSWYLNVGKIGAVNVPCESPAAQSINCIRINCHTKTIILLQREDLC